MPFDWRQFHANQHPAPAVVDPRRRVRICLFVFLAALLIIFGRAVQIEVTQGAGFRAEAVRPIEKKTILPAPRGRILARDGTVLACDRQTSAVAVHYRWLQGPPDERWLNSLARSKLPKRDRRNPQRLAEARRQVLAERAEVASRLASLCHLPAEEWTKRASQIQARVERIAENVNRRQEAESERSPAENESWSAWLRRLLVEDPPRPKIVVAEELDYHVVAEDVPAAVVTEFKEHPDRYPGAKVVDLLRRSYPRSAMAAHVVGHLGPVDAAQLANERAAAADSAEPEEPPHLPNDLVGRMGVERQYESLLRGRRGESVEQTDRSGRLTTRYERAKPLPGEDLTLMLEPQLQQTAETLLQDSLDRLAVRSSAAAFARSEEGDGHEAGDMPGGAIVVMNVEDGSILAAASAPRFDPNAFVVEGRDDAMRLLNDPARPLFDRVCGMAIPPGSTFKVMTAIALLKSSSVRPNDPLECRGYLDQPDRQRCELFIQRGIGHGEVTLPDALAVSCNVYFFHFAGAMGPRPLVDWASRFGFGRATGIDLPNESAGTLPCPENVQQLEGHGWRTNDTQSMAIGQGSLTATPLQVVSMMAAVANGGRLVVPHIAQTSLHVRMPPPEPIPGVQGATLNVIREGLERVVSDPHGTAHDTVMIDSIAIAGKTGTAQTGEGRASHAWFAGYAPAHAPRVSFVVVLEHGGEAAAVAGPVAKRLVLQMQELGMLQ